MGMDTDTDPMPDDVEGLVALGASRFTPDPDDLIRDVPQAAALLSAVVPLFDAVDWDHLLRGIEAAHILGPIMEPTMYRDALHSGQMETNARILRAARDFAAVIHDERARALAKAGRS